MKQRVQSEVRTLVEVVCIVAPWYWRATRLVGSDKAQRRVTPVVILCDGGRALVRVEPYAHWRNLIESVEVTLPKAVAKEFVGIF